METDKLVSWRVLPLIDHKLYIHSYKYSSDTICI